MWRKFGVYYYYFIAELVYMPIRLWDWPLYALYLKWIIKSAVLDKDNILWKKPDVA